MSLLQMSFLGTVIILLIVVLRAVLINRLPKKTFLILWWIALIRLLVPFSIKSVTSIYSLLQSIYSDINPVRTAQTTTFLPIHGNMPEIANGLSEAMVQRTESISILSVIWLAGLLLCFGFFAVSYIKCYREFRFSLPVENDILEAWKEKHPLKRSLSIRQTETIAAPLSYGVIRPVILMPKNTEWKNIYQLRYVLEHEYVHIRRLDMLTKLIMIAAVCIHWFNPLADFPNYLIHRAEQLENLYIFTNTEGTPENIRKFHPNLIVSSTGSAPLLPPIRGLHDRIDKEGSKVASILGMINHINDYPEDMTGKKVVVVGGGAVGLDVVEFFADRNADISIVEMMDQIGRDLDPVSKNDTKAMMKKHNVHQLTKTALLEVKDSSFLVKGDGEPYELPFEYGFVCLGMRAQGQLYQSLAEEFSSEDVEIMNIGDSQRARRIIDGTQEGRNILTILEQKGYL